MQSLSDLTQRAISLLRDHFQIGNEPPPPCPDSFIAWTLLHKALLDLRKTLPPKGSFHSCNPAEIYHHEITTRLWAVVEELVEHITVPKDHVGGLAALPPVPQQAFSGLCWAAERLEAAEPPAPPLDDPIAEVLRGKQALVLYRRLAMTSHYVDYDDLADLDCWQDSSPHDGTIQRGLKKLQTELNKIGAGVTLEIRHTERRAKICR